MTENADVIIYISDKYDLTHESFEKKLQKKIDNLNIKENLIFLDKLDIVFLINIQNTLLQMYLDPLEEVFHLNQIILLLYS